MTEEELALLSPEEQEAYLNSMRGMGAASATAAAGAASYRASEEARLERAAGGAAAATAAAGEASRRANQPKTLASIFANANPGGSATYGATSAEDPYAEINRRLGAGDVAGAMHYAELNMPELYSELTSGTASGTLDVDPLDATSSQVSFGEDPETRFARRFQNKVTLNQMGGQPLTPYTEGSISGMSLVDLVTGLPISSAKNLLEGNETPGDLASLLTGQPVGAAGNVIGTPNGGGLRGSSLVANEPTTDNWLDFFATPPGHALLNKIGITDQEVASVFGDKAGGLPDLSQTGGGEGEGNGNGQGGQGGAGGVTEVTPLNRSDFDVQRVTESWMAPGVTDMASQLYEEGKNFTPRDVPQISLGSPEAIAAYEEAIRNQQGAAGAVGNAAGMQTWNLQDIMANRDLYEAAARGEAPSAAEALMQQGLTQAQRNALSMAATSRDPGGYYRAQRSIGNLQNNAVMEAARLRAEEMAAARAGLTAYNTAVGQAGYTTTAGAAAAAAAAGDVTGQTLAKMAQEENISIEQARDELLARQTDDTARTNIINSATNLINARTQALQGQAQENRAVSEGGQAYATALANQEVTMRGQDTAAASAANVASIGTGSAQAIEAARLKAAKEAGYINAGATMAAGIMNAAGGESDKPKTTTLITSVPGETSTTSTPTTTMTPENLEDELTTGWETQEDYPLE